MDKSVFRISIILLMLGLFLTGTTSGENAAKKILSDIEEYIKAGRSAPAELGQSIIEQIELSPDGIASALIQKTNVAGVSDEALSVYVWAIGFTKDANAVEELIKISSTSESQLVKGNALRSLAIIGGDEAGDYLLSQAKAAHYREDTEAEPKGVEKFDILNCLAEMRYAPALAEMEGLLRKDYKDYYWQNFFCFGKMGDKAVPYLLDKINNSNKNIRLNSIVVLGVILIAPEAGEALAVQYWKEKDPVIRRVILSSIEKIVSDMGEMERFFKEVSAKEQDKDTRQFVEETLSMISIYREKITELKGKKRDNRELFEEAYKALYKSCGKDGDMEMLSIYSRPDDEPRLKELRERILFRNSDECFYDYKQVNKIILFNRLISKCE